MSDGNLKELYDACDGEFDIPYGAIPGVPKNIIIAEAVKAAAEIDNMLYVYVKDSMCRLTTHFPDGWKTNGIARVYPGGRIEYRKLIKEVVR